MVKQTLTLGVLLLVLTLGCTNKQGVDPATEEGTLESEKVFISDDKAGKLIEGETTTGSTQSNFVQAKITLDPNLVKIVSTQVPGSSQLTVGISDNKEEDKGDEPAGSEPLQFVTQVNTSIAPIADTNVGLDLIHVFYRCPVGAGSSQSNLCHIKGPATVADWQSRAGYAGGYAFGRYSNIDISSTPNAIADPYGNIHVFAPINTGDPGGAFGYRYFKCKFDQISCEPASDIILESKVHFRPALFVKPGTPTSEPWVVGFQHGGYGGQLLMFRININDQTLSYGWVGDHLSVSGKESCGQYANIDKTPTLKILDRGNGKELHLWARAGHGNPLHLYLTPTEYAKFSAGNNYTFQCEKFEWEGGPRLGSSPESVVTPNEAVLIGYHEGGDPGAYAWRGFFVRDNSIWLGVNQPGHRFFGPTDWIYLAPEEKMTVVRDVDPSGWIYVFYRFNSDYPVSSYFPDLPGVNELKANYVNYTRLRLAPTFTTTTHRIMPRMLFLDAPGAIWDKHGKIHVFGASQRHKTNIGTALIEHWVMTNEDPNDLRNDEWSDGYSVGNPYGAEFKMNEGVSGVSVVYTTEAKPPGVNVVPTQTFKDGVNLNPPTNSEGSHLRSTSPGSISLEVTKDDGLGGRPIAVSTTFTYTITMTNNGPGDVAGVTLNDPLPAQVTLVSLTSSQGPCGDAGGIVNCELGNISAGETVTVTITVNALTAGDAVNTVTVTTSLEDLLATVTTVISATLPGP